MSEQVELVEVGIGERAWFQTAPVPDLGWELAKVTTLGLERDVWDALGRPKKIRVTIEGEKPNGSSN